MHTVNQLRRSLARRAVANIGRQPCDLARLTIEVAQRCRAIDKRIDLGYEGAEPGAPGVAFEGNPTLLKELVRNLLDNAINYTPSTPERPGVITARVLADPFGRIVVLQVEDNGPGIPESERELVFQPFYRVLGKPGRFRAGPADRAGIARQHFATVRLEDAHPVQHPPGTLVSLRFDANERRAERPRALGFGARPWDLRICGERCVRRCGSRSLKRAGWCRRR
jgi:two-component system sensor histidine kinase TctE